eukprot:TRINITY_DN10978_c0_g1_i1.p1 TRINITY_DN10978_c0_g1~~TRINITY_DN10978_c0_g1_i1.p1  ORF type:complete len:102 (-),score=21.39 TRINITY_DN10978_c0_g1_i1:24-329(-)
MATVTKPIVHTLKFQKRMAMEILRVGQRHVWLNPEKKHEIAKARTRAAIRDLIATNVIQLKPGLRGKRGKLDSIKVATNPIVQRINLNYKQAHSSWGAAQE